MQYFNIQVASQLSGVASATIRAWEKRYNAVVPERAENKHRLYSEKDIEKLGILYQLTELGQSIGKIAHLSLEELKTIYSNLLHRPYEERHVMNPHHDKVDYEKILNSLYLALEAYKIDILSHELEKAKNLVTPKDLCLRVIVPLFREVGNKFNRGELSIAQEHTLTAIVKFHMGQMIGSHYQRKHFKDKLLLLTTPENEMHEIGILAAALLCVHYGIKFIYLGAGLPALSLSETANALKADAVILGVTRHEFNEKMLLEKYLQDLRETMNKDVDIWIGGNLKPYIRGDVEKMKMKYFSTLNALDETLQKLS